MKHVSQILMFAVIAFAGVAQAYSGSNFQMSTFRSDYNKVQMAAHQAQEDIYLYLATDGQEVRANLVSAIKTVQEINAQVTEDEALDILIEALEK